MKKLLLVIVAIALGVDFAWAACNDNNAGPSGEDLCYVTTGGVSSGDCPSGTPCNLEYAVETVAASGNIVTAADGTYATPQLSIPPGVKVTSTSADKTLVIINPGSNMSVGTPLIVMNSGTPGTAGGQTLSYLTIDGTGTYTARQGLQISDYNDVTIDNCEIRDFTGVATTSQGSSSWGVEIKSTEISYTQSWWTFITTDFAKSGSYPANPVSGLIFTNNYVHDCGYHDGVNLHNANAMFVFHIANSSITDNVFDQSHTRSEFMETTVALWDTVNFSRNRMIAHTAGSLDGGLNGTLWTAELWVLFDCTFDGNLSQNAGMSLTVGNNVEYKNNFIDLSTVNANNSWTIGIEATLQNNVKLHHNRYRGVQSPYFVTKGGAFTVGPAGTGSPDGSTMNIYVWANEAEGEKTLYGIKLDSAYDSTITTNYYVINNTVHNFSTSNSRGIYIDDSGGGTDNIRFQNNVLYDLSGTGIIAVRDSNSTATWSPNGYNLYNGNTTNSSPTSIYTGGTANVSSAPTFSEYPLDLTPLAGSPQTGAGIYVGSINTVDVSELFHQSTDWSGSVPSVIVAAPSSAPAANDIGAHGYGGSVTDVTGPSISGQVPANGTILAAGTTSTPVQVTATDSTAVSGVKWDSNNAVYGSMANSFSDAGGGLYTSTFTGLSDSTEYIRYCAASDTLGNITYFQINFAVTSATSDIIIDNTSVEFTATGTLLASTATAGYYGTNYFHNNAVTTGTSGSYDIASILQYPGYYQVWENHTAYINRPDAVPHVLTHTGGETTIYVNQQINGGQWNLLGTYYFSTAVGELVIQMTDDGYTVADAIKLVLSAQEPDPPAQQGVTRSMEVGSGVVNIKGGGNLNIQ